MKTLIAYYSLEGNCRDLSMAMAGALECDVAEIIPVKQPIPDRGFFRYFKGGRESIMKNAPEIAPLSKDVSDYDLIIVGCPVWAWSMATPARTFLSGQNWAGKSVGLFCMHRGGKGHALSAMRELVEATGGKVVDAADFRDLRRGDSEQTLKEAVLWAKGLLEGR